MKKDKPTIYHPVVCPLPKPHPTAVMAKTLRFMEEEHLTYEESRERAKEETLKEKKYHGVSKMKYDICMAREREKGRQRKLGEGKVAGQILQELEEEKKKEK